MQRKEPRIEHGSNTNFTNDGTNPCFICVSSVAQFPSLLRNKSDPNCYSVFSIDEVRIQPPVFAGLVFVGALPAGRLNDSKIFIIGLSAVFTMMLR